MLHGRCTLCRDDKILQDPNRSNEATVQIERQKNGIVSVIILEYMIAMKGSPGTGIVTYLALLVLDHDVVGLDIAMHDAL